MKVRLNAATTDDVFVVGLGTVTPNTWVDLSDIQVTKFEQVNGIRIQDSGLEIKPTRATKKKEAK